MPSDRMENLRVYQRWRSLTRMKISNLLQIYLATQYGTEGESSEDEYEAFDDVKGGKLFVDLVRTARQEEMQFVRERQIYEYRITFECIQKTGRPPVNVKWVDTNKGDDAHPLVRSRLVAMEFRRPLIEKWFAATPPIEALRVLLVIAAAGCSEGQTPRKLLHINVSRAHWYPKAIRVVYVRLPLEDPRGGDASVCGKLKKTMYGTLDAAQRWAEHYGTILVKADFVKGVASPCHFYHLQKASTWSSVATILLVLVKTRTFFAWSRC